jgi:hypothetical protein
VNRRGKKVVGPPWHGAFYRALRTGSFFVAHVIVALVFIGGIELIQLALLKLGDPKLFDILPLRYIFDAMDLAILVAFLVLGTVEAVTVFKAPKDD